MRKILLLFLLCGVLAQPPSAEVNITLENYTMNVTYGEDFRYHAHFFETDGATLLEETCTYYVLDDEEIIELMFNYQTAIDTGAFDERGYSMLTGNNGTINVRFNTLGLDIGTNYRFEIFCGEAPEIGWDVQFFTVNYKVMGELSEDTITFILANMGTLVFAFLIGVVLTGTFVLISLFIIIFPDLRRPKV